MKLKIRHKLSIKFVHIMVIHVNAKLQMINVVTPEKRETQDNLNIEIN